MPCFHPLPAWRTRGGEVRLGKEPPDSEHLSLPCGSCLGCRQSTARAWALRCHLELQDHPAAVFTTLTYADSPQLLWKPDLQLWLKRLRKKMAATRIRFFAVGEYGEVTQRPHYHAILYGLCCDHREQIEQTWQHGHTHTVPVTPAAIAYVAGYCQKKIGWRLTRQVDSSTGEVLYEPPFREMSRRPGIGANAKRYPHNWRAHAIYQGSRIPVPRFLHSSWRENATADEIDELKREKATRRLLTGTQTTEEILEQRAAAEAMLAARHNLQAARRKYG